ncbi:MAG: hypothetical protein M1819_000461 [Sarea resinae]|nr:MAG: hypothetical protein M1819_000461 [Sarea resinae]
MADYVTVNDHLDRQRRIDDRIRASFVNVHEKVDVKFEHADRRFDQIDRRFEQFDRRFDKIEVKLSEHDKLFQQILYRDERRDKLQYNTLGLEEHRSYRTLQSLIDLAQFYQLDPKAWGRMTHGSEEDSESSTPDEERLPTAVRKYPLAWHRTLASRLGLNYHEISKSMEQEEASREALKRKRPHRKLQGRATIKKHTIQKLIDDIEEEQGEDDNPDQEDLASIVEVVTEAARSLNASSKLSSKTKFRRMLLEELMRGVDEQENPPLERPAAHEAEDRVLWDDGPSQPRDKFVFRDLYPPTSMEEPRAESTPHERKETKETNENPHTETTVEDPLPAQMFLARSKRQNSTTARSVKSNSRALSTIPTMSPESLKSTKSDRSIHA